MSIDNNQQMIEKQAEIISKQNEQLRLMKERLKEAEDRSYHSFQRAEFYRILETAVTENISLREAWGEFVMILRLAKPEIDEEFKSVPLSKRL